jgi:hypothetical protein
MLDTSGAEAELEELLTRDHPMLAAGELTDRT